MSKIAGELNAEMSKTIGSKEYNEWLNSPLTKALKRSFEQSITDPENQPSQYGTVTLDIYERLEEQLAAFIEKLEALPEYWSSDIGDAIVKVDDLRAIIEQEKSKISEVLKNSQAEQEKDKLSTSEPVGVVEYDYYPDGFPKGQWGKLTQSFMIAEGTPLYTSPQPTPQDAIDAERYRWLREGCNEKYTKASFIASQKYGFEWDKAIDQAMKNE